MTKWQKLYLLLAGSPDEILPGRELDDMMALARQWSAHPSLDDMERRRIQVVWLEGTHHGPIPPGRARMAELQAIAEAQP